MTDRGDVLQAWRALTQGTVQGSYAEGHLAARQATGLLVSLLRSPRAQPLWDDARDWYHRVVEERGVGRPATNAPADLDSILPVVSEELVQQWRRGRLGIRRKELLPLPKPGDSDQQDGDAALAPLLAWLTRCAVLTSVNDGQRAWLHSRGHRIENFPRPREDKPDEELLLDFRALRAPPPYFERVHARAASWRYEPRSRDQIESLLGLAKTVNQSGRRDPRSYRLLEAFTRAEVSNPGSGAEALERETRSPPPIERETALRKLGRARSDLSKHLDDEFVRLLTEDPRRLDTWIGLRTALLALWSEELGPLDDVDLYVATWLETISYGMDWCELPRGVARHWDGSLHSMVTEMRPAVGVVGLIAASRAMVRRVRQDHVDDGGGPWRRLPQLVAQAQRGRHV